MMKKIALIMICLLLVAEPLWAARIKDIAAIGGVRTNQLVGYGLVVGLMGTGDDVKNGFTRETIANMLSRQGLSIRSRDPAILLDRDLKAKNVASVMVTATLPAFAKNGTRIDALVSSMGDATSMQGGTLIMTPLRAPNGDIYAVAQGGLVIGGFSAGGANASAMKNQTNVGVIPNGALVEKEIPFSLENTKTLTINLFYPDFTTSKQMAQRLNTMMNIQLEAQAKDSGTVAIKLKDAYKNNVMDIISELENLDVSISTPAVVVINEKTGTVVMGEMVRISTVAVAHGNLTIQIKETPIISQPLPFSPQAPLGSKPMVNRKDGTIVAPGGQTVVAKDTKLSVTEEKKQLMVVPRGVSIQEVVQALNAIGVTPRDLISILQAIKTAGALQADLRVM